MDPIKRQNNKSTTSAWSVGQVNLNSQPLHLGDLETCDSIIMIMLDTGELAQSQVSKCSRIKMQRLTLTMSALSWWWWRGGRIEPHISQLSKCSRRLCEQYNFLFVEGKGRGGWSQNNHNTSAICKRKYPGGFSIRSQVTTLIDMCGSNLIFHLLFTLDTRDP